MVLVGVAALVMVVGAAGSAHAADSAEACVNIQSAELGTGLAFDVQNTCDRRLSCALTWTLTCENASGKATSKVKQEARFLVSVARRHVATRRGALDQALRRSAVRGAWAVSFVAPRAATASASSAEVESDRDR